MTKYCTSMTLAALGATPFCLKNHRYQKQIGLKFLCVSKEKALALVRILVGFEVITVLQNASDVNYPERGELHDWLMQDINEREYDLNAINARLADLYS